jgi:hypothetical protein
MWLWLTATARAHAVPETIAAKRHQWVTQGKDRQLRERCRSAQRYVVEKRTPSQVFWLLETDDPNVVKLITDHFGDLWDIDIRQVTPQAIGQASAG